MRRSCLFAWLLASCTVDPPTEVDCSARPDFDVVITALDAALPADIVVIAEYGGGHPEEYRPGFPGTHEVLFCSLSDRDGNPLDGGATPGHSSHGGEGGAATHAGASGEGGGSGGIQALRCTLWTDGPARLIVRALTFAEERVELELPARGQCTKSYRIDLGPSDAGA